MQIINEGLFFKFLKNYCSASFSIKPSLHFTFWFSDFFLYVFVYVILTNSMYICFFLSLYNYNYKGLR